VRDCGVNVLSVSGPHSLHRTDETKDTNQSFTRTGMDQRMLPAHSYSGFRFDQRTMFNFESRPDTAGLNRRKILSWVLRSGGRWMISMIKLRFPDCAVSQVETGNSGDLGDVMTFWGRR
jgi:hypothetical protein